MCDSQVFFICNKNLIHSVRGLRFKVCFKSLTIQVSGFLLDPTVCLITCVFLFEFIIRGFRGYPKLYKRSKLICLHCFATEKRYDINYEHQGKKDLSGSSKRKRKRKKRTWSDIQDMAKDLKMMLEKPSSIQLRILIIKETIDN